MTATFRVGLGLALVLVVGVATAPARAGGPFLASNPASYEGKTVGSGECVAFVPHRLKSTRDVEMGPGR